VLAVWMFFLIQALYFVIVEAPPACNSHETLRRRAQALIREQKLESAFAALQLSAHPGPDK
jgi:hypothetical protein